MATHKDAFDTHKANITTILGQSETTWESDMADSVDDLAAEFDNMSHLAITPSTADPNVTLKARMLTNHVNSPDSAAYWHIQTVFYESILTASNRAQIAQRYNGSPDNQLYIRRYFSSVWSSWEKLLGTTELDTELDTKADGQTESYTCGAAGWYRIANGSSNGAQNTGIFTLKAAVSGNHMSITFAVSSTYGANPSITILDVSSYTTQGITNIRLLEYGTYDQPFIEVQTNTAAVALTISAVIPVTWTLLSSATAGSIPTDYSDHVLEIPTAGMAEFHRYAPYVFTPTSGTIMRFVNTAGTTKDFMYRHTANGAISFGADDAMIVGSGEARATVVANVTLASEILHLGSDQQVIMYSNLQNGWANRKAFSCENTGYYRVPNGIEIVDGNTRIEEGVNNSIQVQTNSGNCDIGPQTTSHNHIYTDRADHYSNKDIYASDFVLTSDIIFKEQVSTLENALGVVLQLNTVRFKWNEKAKGVERYREGYHIGLIAQATEKILPEIVTTDQDGYKGISYAKLAPVNTAAIKEMYELLSPIMGLLKLIRRIKRFFR